MTDFVWTCDIVEHRSWFDALSWWRRVALVCVLALDRWRTPRWLYFAAYRLLMPRIFGKNPD
jgi:hypothetical protein